MRHLLLGTVLVCSSLAGWASAQSPVVVELFTSQGCSSCPPADTLLAELGARDDVIPLALHVDYWDYIGWADRFADPNYTKRQKGYARSGGWKMIYTPQMVLNGTHDVVGNRPMRVVDRIRKEAARAPEVDLQLRREGNTLFIRAEPLAPVKPCDIHILRYEPQEQVAIRRGENAGRTLTYTHIVDDWDIAGQWDGKTVYEAQLRLTDDDPVVVLVQGKSYGRIVAAARLR